MKQPKLSKEQIKEKRIVLAMGLGYFVFLLISIWLIFVTVLVFVISYLNQIGNSLFNGILLVISIICFLLALQCGELIRNKYNNYLRKYQKNIDNDKVQSKNHNQISMMMNLWVKDKSSGVIHQIGTDVHDSLVYIDGKVEYYNLQNGEGTMGDDLGGYEFVEQPDFNGFDDYVSITPEQLYLNRKLIHKDLLNMLNSTEEV